MCPSTLITVIVPLLFFLAIYSVIRRGMSAQSGSGLTSGTPGFVVTGSLFKKTVLLEGASYRQWHTRRGKNGPLVLHLEVSCSCPRVEFRITNETGFDRAGKAWGLSKEIQTGDGEFDKKFYIWTDTVRSVEHILSDSENRNRVRELFQKGCDHVAFNGKSLSIECVESHSSAAESLAKTLFQLSAGLLKAGPGMLVPGCESVRTRRSLLFFVTGFVFIFGIISFVWGMNSYPLVNPAEVFQISLVYSVSAFLIFIVYAFWNLRGSSSAHRDLSIILIMSLVGFGMLSNGVITNWNGAADTSIAEEHHTLIVNKYIHRGSKGRRSYYVTVQSWNDPAGATKNFKVSHSAYETVTPGKDRMRVVTRQGRLGYEWVVSRRLS